jgi:hypothetical protein
MRETGVFSLETASGLSNAVFSQPSGWLITVRFLLPIAHALCFY